MRRYEQDQSTAIRQATPATTGFRAAAKASMAPQKHVRDLAVLTLPRCQGTPGPHQLSVWLQIAHVCVGTRWNRSQVRCRQLEYRHAADCKTAPA